MTKKQSSRGRKQDRARVAGGQDYEVRYQARKTGLTPGVGESSDKGGRFRLDQARRRRIFTEWPPICLRHP